MYALNSAFDLGSAMEFPLVYSYLFPKEKQSSFKNLALDNS
jgi:hypothetical protein